MSESNKIKLLLVDDHTLMRDGVSAMLKQVEDFQIVGTLSLVLDDLKRLVNLVA